MLLAHGASVLKSPAKSGLHSFRDRTHMAAAIQQGNESIVKLLIKSGGSRCITATDKFGRDALAMSELSQQFGIQKILYETGACDYVQSCCNLVVSDAECTSQLLLQLMTKAYSVSSA